MHCILVEEENKNHVIHVGKCFCIWLNFKSFGCLDKHLGTTNLKQVLSLLKSNNYDVSTWHRLCLSLGLLEETLNTIKADEDNVNDCLRTCLYKWLKGADTLEGATWALLENALKDIDQKTVAESKCCMSTIIYCNNVTYILLLIDLRKSRAHLHVEL